MLFSVIMEIKKILILQMGLNVCKTVGVGVLNDDNVCGSHHSFGCLLLSKLLK